MKRSLNTKTAQSLEKLQELFYEMRLHVDPGAFVVERSMQGILTMECHRAASYEKVVEPEDCAIPGKVAGVIL